MTHPVPPVPQPQPKKSRGCLWATLIGLGLVVLFGFVGCVAVIASVGSDSSSSGQSASSGDKKDDKGDSAESSDEEKTAGIGDTVEDGAFAFTVTDIETGVSRIGNDFLQHDAQGQFVIVHVTVENIGDQAEMFYGSSVKLYDADGKEYSNDGEAEIYLEDSEAFLTDINPGNKVDAKVVFDLPEGVEPVSVKLHGSLFSSGVTVSLS